MTLTEYYQTLKLDAIQNAPNFATQTKTELANNLIEATELCEIARYCNDKKEEYNWEHIRSGYYSALLLKYFYKIPKWKKSCASLHREDEEFVSWLMQAIDKAFSYQAWRYEYRAIVKNGIFVEWKLDKAGNKIKNPYYYKVDDTAVDKIINRCCYSIRGYWYQYYNKKKRKGEITNSYSWEQLKTDFGDCVEKSIDEDANKVQLKQPKYTPITKFDSGVYDLVNRLVKQGDFTEALIADGLCSTDTRVKVNGKTQFSQKKLTKQLNSIDAEYAKTFLTRYDISAYNKGLNDTINKIKLEPNYINNETEKFIAHMRQRPDYIALLMK